MKTLYTNKGFKGKKSALIVGAQNKRNSPFAWRVVLTYQQNFNIGTPTSTQTPTIILTRARTHSLLTIKK
jgi:hypothetical protein